MKLRRKQISVPELCSTTGLTYTLKRKKWNRWNLPEEFFQWGKWKLRHLGCLGWTQNVRPKQKVKKKNADRNYNYFGCNSSSSEGMVTKLETRFKKECLFCFVLFCFFFFLIFGHQIQTREAGNSNKRSKGWIAPSVEKWGRHCCLHHTSQKLTQYAYNPLPFEIWNFWRLSEVGTNFPKSGFWVAFRIWQSTGSFCRTLSFQYTHVKII